MATLAEAVERPARLVGDDLLVLQSPFGVRDVLQPMDRLAFAVRSNNVAPLRFAVSIQVVFIEQILPREWSTADEAAPTEVHLLQASAGAPSILLGFADGSRLAAADMNVT
jgi:hypothetical protein